MHDNICKTNYYNYSLSIFIVFDNNLKKINKKNEIKRYTVFYILCFIIFNIYFKFLIIIIMLLLKLKKNYFIIFFNIL